MYYDAQNDEYTCQNGRKPKAVYQGKRKSKSGFVSEITYYECENCEDCPHKKNCTRGKGNRKMQVSKKSLNRGNSHLPILHHKRGYYFEGIEVFRQKVHLE